MKKLLLTLWTVASFLMVTTALGQIVWVKHPDNPVLTATEAWEGTAVACPSVVKVNGMYYMWYSGDYHGAETQVGLARSTDGITWIKEPANPVLTPGPPGSWDADDVGHCNVVYDPVSDTFWMWYTGHASGYKMQIGVAWSSDGVDWTKSYNNPILGPGPSGDWDDKFIRYPAVVYEPDDSWPYKLWYVGRPASSNRWQIGMAASKELDIKWHKHPNNPILPIRPDCWDSRYTCRPSVIHRPELPYEMFYCAGYLLSEVSIGYAISCDAYHWKRYTESVLVATQGWEGTGVLLPDAMYDEEEGLYKLWYSNEPTDAIGYAEYECGE